MIRAGRVAGGSWESGSHGAAVERSTGRHRCCCDAPTHPLWTLGTPRPRQAQARPVKPPSLAADTWHPCPCIQPSALNRLPPRLIRELLEAAPGSVVADAVDTLAATGGSVLKMVHTHDGAAAACMALAYGTPRDRKRLVKGMKGELEGEERGGAGGVRGWFERGEGGGARRF